MAPAARRWGECFPHSVIRRDNFVGERHWGWRILMGRGARMSQGIHMIPDDFEGGSAGNGRRAT